VIRNLTKLMLKILIRSAKKNVKKFVFEIFKNCIYFLVIDNTFKIADNFFFFY
jgi:hypothetical protein